MRATACVALGAMSVAACADVWGFRDLTGADGGVRVDGGSGSGSGGSGGADASSDGTPAPDASGDAPSTECDAGLSGCGSSCVNEQTDPNNCGACSHSCQDGACQLGSCQPVMLASGLLYDAGGSPAGPTYLALDATNVYWVDGASVMKCAKTGCSNVPTTLASGQSPGGLAVRGTIAYWTNGGSIEQCATEGGGGQPTALATLPSAFEPGIAVDTTKVYFVGQTVPDSGGGTVDTVMSCAVGGCSNQPNVIATLGQGENIVGLAVDSTGTYWAGGGSGGFVMTCALGGCSGQPVSLASGGLGPQGVALDSTSVYWTDQGGTGAVKKCAKTGCANLPTTLASDESGGPDKIAVDATTVYWTVSDDTVRKCASVACGGQPTTVWLSGTLPHDIAVDATSIYWTDYGNGTVMKVAK